MFLITAARRSASCFIASAISASRRSIRDAVLSWLALYRFRLFCFVHDRQAVYAIPYPIDKHWIANLNSAVGSSLLCVPDTGDRLARSKLIALIAPR